MSDPTDELAEAVGEVLLALDKRTDKTGGGFDAEPSEPECTHETPRCQGMAADFRVHSDDCPRGKA